MNSNPNYVKGWMTAEDDIRDSGISFVVNFATAVTDSVDWFAMGYKKRATLAVERRAR